MSRLDEKRFTALGVEWTARFDFNATCAIEAETGKGFYEFVSPLLVKLEAEDAEDPGKVFDAVKGLRQSDIRLVLFHALADAHEVTLEEVGEIIQDIGTAQAMGIVAWAIVQAMAPVASGGTEGNAKAATTTTVKAAVTPNRQQRKTAAKRG